MQNRLKTFTDAENDTEDLLDVAKHALAQEDDLSFAQVALQIKDRYEALFIDMPNLLGIINERIIEKHCFIAE